MTVICLKYASNIANSLPRAVIGAPAGLYLKSSGLRWRLWLQPKESILMENVLIFPGQSPLARYSILWDREAGRHTEIDMFAGHMLRMAEKAGISVPYCEYTFYVIKAMEEKNDGLFN